MPADLAIGQHPIGLFYRILHIWQQDDLAVGIFDFHCRPWLDTVFLAQRGRDYHPTFG
jgi:hypothetical protein